MSRSHRKRVADRHQGERDLKNRIFDLETQLGVAKGEIEVMRRDQTTRVQPIPHDTRMIAALIVEIVHSASKRGG